ncbi:cyclic nucleotide-binding domain-containing protein, partial [Nostoc sp. NIES-2111]
MSKTLGETEMRAAAATDMFRGVSAKCLALLLRDARVQEHPAGAVLFVQGDDAGACYVVLEGWVKLFRSTVVGEEAVIGVLTACQSFAEAPALVGGIFPVSAQAVTPIRLIRIPADSLRRTMLAEPEICLTMLASTLRHLRLLVHEIEDLKARTGAQRVADFLLSLAPRNSGAVKVTLPYDKSLIAGRLGIKPESLSRAFQKLRDHGVSVEQS